MKALRAPVNIGYCVGSHTKKLGMGKDVINSLSMCQLMAWSSGRSRIPGRYLAEFLKLWGTWGSRAGLFTSSDDILVYSLPSDILIVKCGWLFQSLSYLISVLLNPAYFFFIPEMFFLGSQTILSWRFFWRFFFPTSLHRSSSRLFCVFQSLDLLSSCFTKPT